MIHHHAMLIPNINPPSSCILQSSRSEFQPAPINSDKPTSSKKKNRRNYRFIQINTTQPPTYILNQKKRFNHAFKGNQKRVVEVREAMNEEEALDLRAALESEGEFEMGTLGKTANRINIIF